MWIPTEQGLTYKTDAATIRLTGPDGWNPSGPVFELREWDEYFVRADQAELQVNQGRALTKRLSPDLWRVCYQNHIGLSNLHITSNGRPLPPLAVEVYSNKFNSLAEQHHFYHAPRSKRCVCWHSSIPAALPVLLDLRGQQ